MFISDSGNHVIRKIDATYGVITTFAGSGTAGSTDGTGAAASFNAPGYIAIDASNNLYVTDTGSNKIRMITPSAVVTTVAGSGSAGSSDSGIGTAQFSSPTNVVVDSSGNVFIADTNNNAIRKIDTNGIVTTFAGGNSGATDATGTSAGFSLPKGMVIDPSNNIYVADAGNSKIRKITSCQV
jgi:streptogramin lyase